MNTASLNIGRIDYLNILPFFAELERAIPDGGDVRYLGGHPSEINGLMDQGLVDVAPASAFEYLRHAEKYRLLPDLSIASDGDVQSVLLLSPFPFEDLPAYLAKPGAEVGLTSASATSVALLKILWRFAWNLPEPVWRDIAPGAGASLGIPFLEIGNIALRLYLDPDSGLHIRDLGREWRDFTGLPFVFAVWIVRRGLSPAAEAALGRVRAELDAVKDRMAEVAGRLAREQAADYGFTEAQLAAYWDVLRYHIGPAEKAALLLYADYCRRLGLLDGVPGLVFS